MPTAAVMLMQRRSIDKCDTQCTQRSCRRAAPGALSRLICCDCVQISPRKSIQLSKRASSSGGTSLIEAAVRVAWQNLDLYSAAELDELPI